ASSIVTSNGPSKRIVMRLIAAPCPSTVIGYTSGTEPSRTFLRPLVKDEGGYSPCQGAIASPKRTSMRTIALPSACAPGGVRGDRRGSQSAGCLQGQRLPPDPGQREALGAEVDAGGLHIGHLQLVVERRGACASPQINHLERPEQLRRTLPIPTDRP